MEVIRQGCCRDCKYKKNFPWDCHILCLNPPTFSVFVDTGGKSGEDKARASLVKTRQEQ